MTLEEFRKTLRISEEKIGKGDKQETVWYIRDRDDPKGERGSQTTVLNKAALEWTIERRHASHLQHEYNLGRMGLEEAQLLTKVSLQAR